MFINRYSFISKSLLVEHETSFPLVQPVGFLELRLHDRARRSCLPRCSSLVTLSLLPIPLRPSHMRPSPVKPSPLWPSHATLPLHPPVTLPPVILTPLTLTSETLPRDLPSCDPHHFDSPNCGPSPWDCRLWDPSPETLPPLTPTLWLSPLRSSSETPFLVTLPLCDTLHCDPLSPLTRSALHFLC